MSGRGRGGGKRGGKGRGGGTRGVSYLRPQEPAFLKQFKDRIGYKEGPDVDTKREDRPDACSDDEEDREDELPSVVVLKKGDLSAEQARDILIQADEEEKEEELQEEMTRRVAGPEPKDGAVPSKVVFRKPSKHNSSESDLNVSTSKKKKESDKEKKSDAKSVNNKKLLSFDDEEEEEEDE